MSKIFLDPSGFQKQIDAFAKGVGEIKQVEYKADSSEAQLESIDRYLECIAEFNSAIKAFGEYLDLDTKSMKRIKAAWMNLDSEIGTMTLGEILTGSGGK